MREFSAVEMRNLSKKFKYTFHYRISEMLAPCTTGFFLTKAKRERFRPKLSEEQQLNLFNKLKNITERLRRLERLMRYDPPHRYYNYIHMYFESHFSNIPGNKPENIISKLKEFNVDAHALLKGIEKNHS